MPIPPYHFSENWYYTGARSGSYQDCSGPPTLPISKLRPWAMGIRGPYIIGWNAGWIVVERSFFKETVYELIPERKICTEARQILFIVVSSQSVHSSPMFCDVYAIRVCRDIPQSRKPYHGTGFDCPMQHLDLDNCTYLDRYVSYLLRTSKQKKGPFIGQDRAICCSINRRCLSRPS